MQWDYHEPMSFILKATRSRSLKRYVSKNRRKETVSDLSGMDYSEHYCLHRDLLLIGLLSWTQPSLPHKSLQLNSQAVCMRESPLNPFFSLRVLNSEFGIQLTDIRKDSKARPVCAHALRWRCGHLCPKVVASANSDTYRCIQHTEHNWAPLRPPPRENAFTVFATVVPLSRNKK